MFSLALQEKLFYEHITPGVIAQFKARSKMFDKISKKWDKIEANGKYAIQKVMIRGSQSARAGSNSTYPTASQSTPEETKVYMKRANMFTLQFDGMSMEAAARGGAAMDAMEFEKKGLFVTVFDDMSRQLMLDGSGRLCQANGAGIGATALVLDSPFYADATKFLKPGRIIDARLAAGPYTQEIDSITLNAVPTALTATLASAQTWTDDDWIFNEDVFSATEGFGLGEMMGIDGIVRDTDPPLPNAAAGLQGLLVGTYDEWKAVVKHNSGVARALTEDLIIEALDETTDFGDVSVMLYTHKLRRKWLKIVESFKVLSNVKTMWGGWTAIPFIYDGREIPMVTERFVPDGRIYGLTEKDLVMHHLSKEIVSWEKGDSGAILQKVANKNEYVAEGHIFGNLGCSMRRDHFVIKDLSES